MLGDGRGGAIHLGERDCSLQRRHQKVWEEGPSPALTAAARNKIGETVAKAMREIRYLGVGTVEFLYEDGKFYFIEMNTRIQVEHPVTEMITDIDLVLEQIRVAAGGDLPATQKEIVISGHAIECRINAENPVTFRPSPGKILQYHPPGGLGVRIDSAVYQGYVIPPYYDSLVGKLIVHGKTRAECLMRLRRALDEMVVDGIETTLPLFRALVREPEHYRRRLPYPLAGAVPCQWRSRRSLNRSFRGPRLGNKESRTAREPDWRIETFSKQPGTETVRGAIWTVSIRTSCDGGDRRHIIPTHALGQLMLLTAGLVVLTLISATSVYLVNKARDDARWVLHSMEVENEISLALLQMRRAESAQRGFLLTQRPEFRSAFEEAASQIAPSFERLKALTIDNPYQQQRLKQIIPQTNQRIEQLRQGIDLALANRQDEAAEIARQEAGRDAMGHIRGLASEMRAEEDRLFAARTASADASQSLSASITSIGSGLVVVFAGLSIFLVRRSSRARDVAEAQLRDNNLNLESHRRETHRRPARGQRGNPALRLYRQPRPALAAGQHHGLHQRARGTARRHLQADRGPEPAG